MNKILSTFILGVMASAFVQEAKADEVKYIHCCTKTSALSSTSTNDKNCPFVLYTTQKKCNALKGRVRD